ncbi:MAG: TolC family protein [Eubacterium sp.]|nr:TolC family protein [Eubacterium sp.]
MIHLKRWKKRMISIALCLAVFFSALITFPSIRTEAATKVLTLQTARTLALRNSDKYELAQMKVDSKKAERESALKAIKLKKKDLTTFRWSPLLKLKFPQKLNFAQSSEFQLKPVSLAGEIQVAQRNVQDSIYQVTESVNNLFVEIVTLQETGAYNQQKYDTLMEGIEHNKERLKMGEANQSDIDRQEKKAETLNQKIATDRRTLEADLKKLSTMIGLDVTTGYTFEKPYVEATIERSMLPALIEYTEDRDAAYYEACITATTARVELSTNYSLIKSKYRKDIKMISSYVNDALGGRSISSRAFKNAYKKFLEKIDSYWKGKKRICLFIKIPRIWMKGSLDGTRYIDDDPYVLYQNALDYVAARKDEAAAKAELDQSVEDSFNNYINIRSTYEKYIKDIAEEEKKLKEYYVKNRMGYLTLEEYEDAVDAYEELQNSLFETMKLYTQTLYSFDRLTCGGVSALLSGTDADLQVAKPGESHVEKDEKEAQYYLTPIIQRELFELSLYIPEDFPIEITHFEFWCDDTQIGERTEADKSLRHLTLARDNVEKARIRLYNGDDFVDECQIDPSEESGILNIVTAMNINKDETGVVGSYFTTTSDVTGLLSIQFTPLESEEIYYYRILTESGKALGKSDKTDIKEEFRHLGLVSSDLDKLTIEFYGESGMLLYTGYMDVGSGKLKKKETE